MNKNQQNEGKEVDGQMVYDSKDLIIPPNFIETPYKNLNDEVLSRYSLTGWIKAIFNEQ